LYEGPGIYEHYKGGRYRVLGTALHESELYQLVIYVPLNYESSMILKDKQTDYWARPRDVFDEVVNNSHRFRKVN
jgi:hypothetical protein